MKNKILITSLITASAFSSMLIANKNQNAQASKFPIAYNNTKKSVQGGTLKVAQVSDSPFKGVFAPELTEDATTTSIYSFAGNELFNYDKTFKYTDGGAANVKFDDNAKTATITINPKVKWSDGQPLTTDDLIYAYKVIANKDTSSVQYTDNVGNIVGMEEYHTGKANDISGLEKKDDHTLVVHFKKMTPAMEFVGSNYILDSAEPYHYLKDIPFKKLAASKQIRKKPLSFGPYVLTNIVPGESVQYSVNKYYWQKSPAIKHVQVETLSSAQTSTAMKAKKYDLYFDISAKTYNQNKNDKNYKMVGKIDNRQSYLTYLVGYKKNGKAVMDSKRPLTKYKALRQALAYAMNVEQITKKFGYGLTFKATTLTSPYYGKYHDSSVKGYDYNMKKANALLDKAGFKKGKDGYRTLPNGKKLSLTLMTNKSTDDWKSTVTNYIQHWKELGVKVKLYNGRLQEFNTYAELLDSTKKNKGFDMTLESFTTASEPSSDIVQTFSETGSFNDGGFVTKENNELIASLNNEQAFNTDYRIKQFYKWQKYMDKQAYVIPLTNSYEVYPVSTKIKGFTLQRDKQYQMYGNLSFTK